MAARRHIARFSFFSVIMAFFLLLCSGQAQEKEPSACDRIVSQTKFIPIKFPFKTQVQDFALSSNGKEAAFLLLERQKQLIYLYNISARQWRALPREEGERLFKERNKEPYSVLHPQKESISPDGTMVLCIKARKQKKASAFFGLLEGTAAAFAIDVRCSQGTSGRILNLPYDCFFRWKAQWSDKNDFALICDMTQQQNMKQRCYILQLNKNKEEE